MECVAWAVVHDCRFEHTLFWCPELEKIPSFDLRREPWRILESDGDVASDSNFSVKPYKDSPLWFCSANRTNWGYEYFWLPGVAYLPKNWNSYRQHNGLETSHISHDTFQLGVDYPFPMVRPVNLQIDLGKLPVRDFVWGDHQSVGGQEVLRL